MASPEAPRPCRGFWYLRKRGTVQLQTWIPDRIWWQNYQNFHKRGRLKGGADQAALSPWSKCASARLTLISSCSYDDTNVASTCPCIPHSVFLSANSHSLRVLRHGVFLWCAWEKARILLVFSRFLLILKTILSKPLSSCLIQINGCEYVSVI